MSFYCDHVEKKWKSYVSYALFGFFEVRRGIHTNVHKFYALIWYKYSSFEVFVCVPCFGDIVLFYYQKRHFTHNVCVFSLFKTAASDELLYCSIE